MALGGPSLCCPALWGTRVQVGAAKQCQARCHFPIPHLHPQVLHVRPQHKFSEKCESSAEIKRNQ